MVIILLKNPLNGKVLAVMDDDDIALFDDEFAAFCWLECNPLGKSWSSQIVELEM